MSCLHLLQSPTMLSKPSSFITIAIYNLSIFPWVFPSFLTSIFFFSSLPPSLNTACPYHLNFYKQNAPLILALLILSIFLTPDIHHNLISATSAHFSLAFLMDNASAAYGIAGLHRGHQWNIELDTYCVCKNCSFHERWEWTLIICIHCTFFIYLPHCLNLPLPLFTSVLYSFIFCNITIPTNVLPPCTAID